MCEMQEPADNVQYIASGHLTLAERMNCHFEGCRCGAPSMCACVLIPSYLRPTPEIQKYVPRSHSVDELRVTLWMDCVTLWRSYNVDGHQYHQWPHGHN